jgi:hypothetical protein
MLELYILECLFGALRKYLREFFQQTSISKFRHELKEPLNTRIFCTVSDFQCNRDSEAILNLMLETSIGPESVNILAVKTFECGVLEAPVFLNISLYVHYRMKFRMKHHVGAILLPLSSVKMWM